MTETYTLYYRPGGDYHHAVDVKQFLDQQTRAALDTLLGMVLVEIRRRQDEADRV